jgi:hypothetical protein
MGDLGSNVWVVLALVGLVSVAVATLLLRSACDLIGLDPAPTLRRSFTLVVVLTLLNVPIFFAIHGLVQWIAPSFGWAQSDYWWIGAALDLPALLVLCTFILMPALRVRVGRALRISVIFSLLCLLVSAVTGLLVVGVSTVIGSVARLA